MPESRWCNFVARGIPERGFTLLESGISEGLPTLWPTLYGIEFSSKGDDERLWLIRKGRLPVELCARINGHLSPVLQNHVSWNIGHDTYRIKDGAHGLEEDDGFEITKNGIVPIPGTKPGTVEIP